MAATGGEDSDAVLSDIEAEDDPSPPESEFSGEKFRELLAELDREKKSRIAAENSKSEIQNSFNRLKVLAHEAIKKRDEAIRDKDEALKTNENLSIELSEVKRSKEEVQKQVDEAVKAKESSRAEIETAAQMLVTGIEKITGKLSQNLKNSITNGLPRSQKYTGLPAVAYGVIKKTNEIVDFATKSRDEAREMVEQRNYEVAIEVSELEASISRLKDVVDRKNGEIEGLEKCIVEKDRKLEEFENETSNLRKLVDDYECRVKDLDLKLKGPKPLVVEQLNLVSRIHDQLYEVIKVVDANKLEQSDSSGSLLFVAQETGLEENVRASLAGLESIYELSRIVVGKTRDIVEEKSREVKSLNETVARLFREKEHVGVLLRSALSKKLNSTPSSKTNDVLQIAKNGLKEAGIEVKFHNLADNENNPNLNSKEGGQGAKDDEIYALAGALENIIKESQFQFIELQHTVEELRAESILLKEHLETQAKELSLRKQRMEELEEKERQANENIEGLMMDIAAAEEEIARWKAAAEQEAAAGRAVEQEYLTQISTLKQEVEEAKQATVESVKKLKFKEETAAAAMAAREAAEKSLRLADVRASKLRDRIEELTHQLENLDNKDISRNGTRPRYICWPWEWLGIDFVGHRRTEAPEQQNSNEMELSEPLL